MRDIKFRAFYEDEMVPVWFMTCWLPTPSNRNNFKQKWFAGFDDRRELLNDSTPIMQSTGLLDKKGVEGWDGNIYNIDDYTDKYIIEWSDEAARFYLVGVHSRLHKDIRMLKDATLLGSIHTHPELLERKRYDPDQPN